MFEAHKGGRRVSQQPQEQTIRLEDLFGNQRDIAEIIGIEKYIELTKTFGGDNIYIQKYSEVCKIQRNAEIRSKFTGYNSEELAKEYDLTERYVRQLCSDLISERRAALPGQISLFDY